MISNRTRRLLAEVDRVIPLSISERSLSSNSLIDQFKEGTDLEGYTELPWSSSGKPKSFFHIGKKDYKSFSWTKGITEEPLIHKSIGSWFEEQVSDYSDQEFFHSPSEDISMTWDSMNEKVDYLCGGLEAIGMERGDRFAICLPNVHEWVVTFLACCKMGIIVVNINPAFKEYELKETLNQMGCKGLLIMPHLKTSKYLDMITNLLPEINHNEKGNIKGDQIPSLKHIILAKSVTSETKIPSGCHVWEDLLISQSHIKPIAEYDETINIQFTSGTTGMPKGAMLSHHNILNNAKFVSKGLLLKEDDVLVVPVPLFHCFGLVLGLLTGMSAGSSVVLPSPLFDADATLSAVDKYKATTLHGVPTMFIEALNHPKLSSFDFSHLRTGIMAGSTCPKEILTRINTEMNLKQMTVCYGMTETSPVSFQINAKDLNHFRYETVGNIHPHVEAKFVDKNGLVVPSGEKGELLIRGYSVMKGYWNDDEKTKSCIDSDGWMKTGDIGTLDQEGYCRIVGRNKDTIIRGGENIYPRELEEFLHQHPDIKDVQIVGVSSEKFGEEVAAWVITNDDSTFDEEALTRYCKENIAHYKVPSYWFSTDSFPMTLSGKPQKFLLQKQTEELIQSKEENK